MNLMKTDMVLRASFFLYFYKVVLEILGQISLKRKDCVKSQIILVFHPFLTPLDTKSLCFLNFKWWLILVFWIFSDQGER